MATNSKIEWTDATWSPLLGCDRVSPGCDHCYAITSATIRAGNPHPKVATAFAGLTERRDGRLDWTGRINLLPDRLAQPLSWRKPRRIFVNSLADLFHDDVPDEFIARVFAVMALTPQHTYQLLTKRHARMRSLLNQHGFWTAVGVAAIDLCDVWLPAAGVSLDAHYLRNVWLGVSVEDQKWADIRVPALLDTPAAVRWLSCEPLLGPLDLNRWLVDPAFNPAYRVARCGQQSNHSRHVMEHGPDQPRNCPGTGGGTFKPRRLDWAVGGGESGPGARPAHPDWFRSLRDQCTDAGVPFFFKQFGNWRPGGDVAQCASYVLPDGSIDHTGFGPTIPGAVAMVNVGKKAAGRELDGRTWDEYPTAVLTGAVA